MALASTSEIRLPPSSQIAPSALGVKGKEVGYESVAVIARLTFISMGESDFTRALQGCLVASGLVVFDHRFEKVHVWVGPARKACGRKRPP